MRNLFALLSVAFLSFACGSSAADKTTTNSAPRTAEDRADRLKRELKAVESFFEPMREPEPDEWLAYFKEPGQTFEEYIGGRPTLPTAARKTIYIQPIGTFDENQRRVIGLTAEYMREFFGLPVKLSAEEPLNKKLVPGDFRVHPQWKIRQLRTGYFLEKVLAPSLPEDAAALIAFTSEDLYPDETMNFLFGEASLDRRVGVWSLYRLDDDVGFGKFLERTFKIATHETGHMFSMLHCTKYECVLSGTNHLVETDSRPLDACPECMAKICWMSGYDPQQRYENLSRFFRRNNLNREADIFRAKADAVRKVSANKKGG